MKKKSPLQKAFKAIFDYQRPNDKQILLSELYHRGMLSKKDFNKVKKELT